jgi:hypothetical protein
LALVVCNQLNFQNAQTQPHATTPSAVPTAPQTPITAQPSLKCKHHHKNKPATSNHLPMFPIKALPENLVDKGLSDRGGLRRRNSMAV